MTVNTRHFSPRPSLAAVALRLRRLGFFEAIAAHVHVPHKTVRHTPAEKLYDAFVAILSGAHGLSEINTRLRADPVLQRSFGRRTCAEYSLVQDTLDACTQENVEHAASSPRSSASIPAPPATTTPPLFRCSTST
jgi:hypothetical protein